MDPPIESRSMASTSGWGFTRMRSSCCGSAMQSSIVILTSADSLTGATLLQPNRSLACWTVHNGRHGRRASRTFHRPMVCLGTL